MKHIVRSALCAAILLATLSAQGGSVITTNLPAGTRIVNIDASADGAANYDSAQALWYQPFAGVPSLTVTRGTYTFRVISPQDAAAAYPQLTSAQLAQIYTGWTYNSPWTENYMVFQESALSDPTEHQLFDGAYPAGGVSFSSAQAAYDDAKAKGYLNEIRPAPPGRGNLTTDFLTEYAFTSDTTIRFIIPDNGLFDNSGGVSVVVTPIASPSPAPQFANISTREFVQTGDNVLIGGFIVTGTQPKKVLIRALGPSTGVAGSLADPTLELYTGSTLLASNDNWVSSQDKQAIQDTGIAPKNDAESAILRTLPAGNSAYTAVVRGVNNTTGVALVEVYDLDTSVDSRLANISTRGAVGVDPNAMIAGFIIVGGSNQKVVLRVVGPSLGLAGSLANPTLELRDKNGALLGTSDDWKNSGQTAEIKATGIPPQDDREPAIVAFLPAGTNAYTAVVRGTGGSTGIAVVEAYAVQ
ncbi:MAG: hypothetical protein M3Y69_06840 [Verrucomicrobiota bacterium]|nr:hypothetical protein [Verrucomicrobiota bacterium]